MAQNEPVKSPPFRWRLRIGIGFFALSWICPVFIPLVAASDFPTEWKAAISGALVVGGPEVCGLVSIAFLGKAGFNYIRSRLFASLKRAAPSARVGRTRYRIGLGIWGLLAVLNYFIFYAPDLIPGYDANRITINLIADMVFIVTFFVLGGDFWEKFRALFIYEAKALIPDTGTN